MEGKNKTSATIDLLVSEDSFVREILKIYTFNKLTPLEYKVLAEMYNYKKISRREKAKIRLKLELSIHSLNNIFTSLVKKGVLEQDKVTKFYRSLVSIPDKADEVIIKIQKT